jgi:ABC-type Na+ transport system ATPase subunit NatA
VISVFSGSEFYVSKLLTSNDLTDMRKGRKTSLEMQWAIVRLSRIIPHDEISMGLDVSTRTIRRVLSHFQTHGTIPEHSDLAEKQGDESEKKPNRHL